MTGWWLADAMVYAIAIAVCVPFFMLVGWVGMVAIMFVRELIRGLKDARDRPKGER